MEPSYKTNMKHGDLEFHQQTGPILDAITEEGLRIAKENSWVGLVIEITAPANQFERASGGVRCHVKNTVGEPEIDEPSGALLDAANRLQNLFTSVGTPLAGATIDWIDERGDGKVRRRCRYRYD